MTLPIILWFSGYLLDFWYAPVIAFGGMIVIYAFLFLIFVAIPTWFSSVLFVLFGLAGLVFAPDIFLDLPMSSRYVMMGIGIFLFSFGHYFTLKRNISVTPVIHTLTSL